MFSLMPNTYITMPYSLSEAYALLRLAYTTVKAPFVIRYPRDKTNSQICLIESIIDVSWSYLKKGKGLAIISYGPVLDRMLEIAEEFPNSSVVNARFIKPIDEEFVLRLFKTHNKIFIYEEVAAQAGIYTKILDLKERYNYKGKIITKNINEKVLEHGTYESVIKKLGLDNKSICDEIRSLFS
jgi:1-deoxy-D-xylulose-5-phosphate synthase